MTSRGWALTLNNYSQDEYALLSSITTCKYYIIGREVGESGTPHLQGFFYWAKPIRMTALKKLCPRAHWEATKGTPQQNIDYCSKEDPYPLISGDPPLTQKEKGGVEVDRWAAAVAAAKSGDLESIPPDLLARCYRTWKEMKKDYMVTPSDALSTTGVWLCGPAGCGKSRKAREDYPNSYLKMANKWWDGFQDQDTVILDDLDLKHDVLGHHLKIWSDRYAFLAETKGGAITIRPKTIIITSQYTIDDIWHDEETRAALKRRFSVIKMGGYAKLLVQSAFRNMQEEQ